MVFFEMCLRAFARSRTYVVFLEKSGSYVLLKQILNFSELSHEIEVCIRALYPNKTHSFNTSVFCEWSFAKMSNFYQWRPTKRTCLQLRRLGLPDLYQ